MRRPHVGRTSQRVGAARRPGPHETRRVAWRSSSPWARRTRWPRERRSRTPSTADEIAVARSGGTLYAFGDICTHRRCNLSMGGEIEGTDHHCECHGSEFDMSTGAVVDGPATEPVATFEVREEGGELQIGVCRPRDVGSVRRRRRPASPARPRRRRCATEGFDGRIVLIGAEVDLARTNGRRCPRSTCAASRPLDAALVRPAEWYAEHEVEARLGTRAVQLDARPARGRARRRRTRRVRPACSSQPGRGTARLDVPGADLPGVFDLRSRGRTADAIRAAVGGRRPRRLRRHGVHRRRGRGVAAPAGQRRHRGRGVRDRARTASSAPRSAGPIEALHRDHGVAMLFNDGGRELRGRRATRGGRHQRRAGGSRPTSPSSASAPNRAIELMARHRPRSGRRHPGRARPRRPRSTACSRRATSRATITRCSDAIRVEHFDNAVEDG